MGFQLGCEKNFCEVIPKYLKIALRKGQQFWVTGDGGKVGEEHTCLGIYDNLFGSALTDGEISMVTGWLGLWMIRVKGRSFQDSRRPWRKTPASFKSKPGTGIASLLQFRCSTHSQASPDAIGIEIDPLLPGWKVQKAFGHFYSPACTSNSAPPPPSPLLSAPNLVPPEFLSPAVSATVSSGLCLFTVVAILQGYSVFPVSSISASLLTPFTGPSGSSSAVNFSLGNPFPSSSHVKLNFSSDRTKSLQAVFNDSCCFSHEEGSGPLLPIMTSRLCTKQCIMEMKLSSYSLSVQVEAEDTDTINQSKTFTHWNAQSSGEPTI